MRVVTVSFHATIIIDQTAIDFRICRWTPTAYASTSNIVNNTVDNLNSINITCSKIYAISWLIQWTRFVRRKFYAPEPYIGTIDLQSIIPTIDCRNCRPIRTIVPNNNRFCGRTREIASKTAIVCALMYVNNITRFNQ